MDTYLLKCLQPVLEKLSEVHFFLYFFPFPLPKQKMPLLYYTTEVICNNLVFELRNGGISLIWKIHFFVPLKMAAL